jgi:tetratricopeptide (TPR) repeat protein
MYYTRSGKAFRIAALVCIAAAAALGIAAAATPLLDVVGYELAAATAFFLALAGGALGIAAGRETRGPEIPPSLSSHYIVNLKYGRCISIGLVCLILPLAIVSTGSFFVKKCNLGTGLPLFLAITIPTLFHYTAAGLAAGRIFRRSWVAALSLFAYFLATSIYSFILFMIGSQWDLPNLTIGFFSLSGFNGFDLVVPACFYASRALALFMSASFLGAAILANPQQHTARTNQDTYFGVRGVGVTSAIFLVCLLFFPDQTGLGSGRRTLNAELSVRRELPHAVLHYSPGAMPASEAARAARFTEWYIHEIGQAVPIGPKWKIHVWLYKDNEQKVRLVSARDVYFSAPWLHEVHINKWAVDSDIFKHELTHAVMAEFAKGIFGTPYNMGMVEGIAEAVQMDYFRGPAFQETFAASEQAKVLAPGQQTLTNFGFGANNMWKSYNMAGGFTGFLIYKYGIEKYTRFYGDPAADKVYGKSLGQLNGEWIRWLRSIPVSAYARRQAEFQFNDVAFPAFYKSTCPRVGGRLGSESPDEQLDRLDTGQRYSAYANLCDEFYKKDSNPDWLVRQSRMYLETRRPAHALDASERALGAKKISRGTKADAYFIRALSLAALGRFGEAVKALEKCGELGQAPPDKIQMEILILREPLLREFPMYEYFLKGRSGAETLEKAIAKDPDFGVLYGELASILSEGDFLDSDEYLTELQRLTDRFIELTPGLNKSKIDALAGLGNAYIEYGKYVKAVETFEKIKTFTKNEKDLFTARRDMEQAVFFKNVKF